MCPALKPCERLSARQRQATPPAFAEWLLGLVRQAFGPARVAVLWVMPRTVYGRWWPAVDLWGRQRDANRYAGPWPVICHPPCGPWGKYHRVCRQSRQDGIHAIALTHRWGGLVEHPVGSSLFRDHGRPGAEIIQVNQGDYGHQALKPTLIYFVKARECEQN